MSDEANPLDASHCFVCGPNNSLGLKVEFQLRDNGVCVGEFTPGEAHQGADGVTHGGIAGSSRSRRNRKTRNPAFPVSFQVSAT